MEAKHKAQGVVLLAINLDDPESRSKIPNFLKKYGIRSKVLLGDSESIKGYDTEHIGLLYVVDRRGALAGSPGEFAGRMEKKAEARVSYLLSPNPVVGRMLYEVEKAPTGFGILWRRPLQANITAVALAPHQKGHLPEIGVLGDSRLIRYSASGELVGEAPVEEGEFNYLEGADLDGDGKNEWLAGEEKSFLVMDSEGEPYWHYHTLASTLRIAGLKDLNGDGSLEIVIQDSSSVVAKKSLSGNLWRTPPLGSLKSVVPDPSGTFLVQTEDGIQALDRQGHLGGVTGALPKEAILAGRIDRGHGVTLDVVNSANGPAVQILEDLTGDGEKAILVVEGRVVAVYSLDGKPLLLLTFSEAWNGVKVVAADLDGRPGDELVLAIPQYGLVAMGRSPQQSPTARPSKN